MVSVSYVKKHFTRLFNLAYYSTQHLNVHPRFQKSVQFFDYETDSLKSEVCESWDIKVVIFSIPSHSKVGVQTPLVEDGKCLSREVVFLLNDHLVFSIYTQSLRKHTRSLYGNKHRNATSTMCWWTGNIIPLEKSRISGKVLFTISSEVMSSCYNLCPSKLMPSIYGMLCAWFFYSDPLGNNHAQCHWYI